MLSPESDRIHNNNSSISSGMSGSVVGAGKTKEQLLNLYNRFQYILDQSNPFPLYRWLGCLALFCVYWLRVLSIGGFYVVTYALHIYLLNALLLFLSPKFDPSLEEDSLDNAGGFADAPGLPLKANEDFKPFIRRLPEFKFWWGCARALAISFFCTFFAFLDIPVFWPILLLYFVILFGVTMKRQIKHMIKYKYVPFDLGKKTYSSTSAK